MTKTKVQFFGTKVEVTLIKAEPGQWTKLDVPRAEKVVVVQQPAESEIIKDDGIESDEDLDTIEATSGVVISEMASVQLNKPTGE